MPKPSPWDNTGGNKKHTCIGAGIALQRDNESFKNATPILFQSNITAKPEAFIIPHSELAMHVGAAGKEILALFCTTTSAYVVYGDGEGCGYVSGALNELLGPEMRAFMEKFPKMNL